MGWLSWLRIRYSFVHDLELQACSQQAAVTLCSLSERFSTRHADLALLLAVYLDILPTHTQQARPSLPSSNKNIAASPLFRLIVFRDRYTQCTRFPQLQVPKSGSAASRTA